MSENNKIEIYNDKRTGENLKNPHYHFVSYYNAMQQSYMSYQGVSVHETSMIAKDETEKYDNHLESKGG